MGQGASAFMTKANPFIGIATTGLNIGMSLVEASKQKELQRAADRQAEKSAAEQERLLSQDFYQGLQVPMEVYDREFAANTASEKQVLEALVEGDQRLVLGGVGKSQAVTVDRNAQTADRAADKLYNLAMTQAGAAERANLRLAPLEAERLKGAQEASAAAQMAKVQAQQKALGAGGDLIKGLGAIIPEYSKTKAAGLTGAGSGVFNKFMNYQQPTSQLGISQLAPAPQAPLGFGQGAFNPFAAVSTMSPVENSLDSYEFIKSMQF